MLDCYQINTQKRLWKDAEVGLALGLMHTYTHIHTQVLGEETPGSDPDHGLAVGRGSCRPLCPTGSVWS